MIFWNFVVGIQVTLAFFTDNSIFLQCISCCTKYISFFAVTVVFFLCCVIKYARNLQTRRFIISSVHTCDKRASWNLMPTRYKLFFICHVTDVQTNSGSIGSADSRRIAIKRWRNVIYKNLPANTRGIYSRLTTVLEKTLTIHSICLSLIVFILLMIFILFIFIILISIYTLLLYVYM